MGKEGKGIRGGEGKTKKKKNHNDIIIIFNSVPVRITRTRDSDPSVSLSEQNKIPRRTAKIVMAICPSRGKPEEPHTLCTPEKNDYTVIS